MNTQTDPVLELVLSAEALLAALRPRPPTHAAGQLVSPADELRARAVELAAEADRLEARAKALMRVRGAVTAVRQQMGPKIVREAG